MIDPAIENDPKLAGACCVCDAECRPVAARKPDGTPHRMGGPNEGTREASLVHVDGSHSEHTLCSTCNIEPKDIPIIWRRACLLYAKGIRSERPADSIRYQLNVPIGLLSVRTF